MPGQLPHKLLGILQGFLGFNVKFRANFAFHDFAEWGCAVRRLPDHRTNLVQAEQGRIAGGHDDHLVAEHARCDIFASGQVKRTHVISSQTRASGVNTSRRTGTRLTKSQTVWKIISTNSSSWAKKRMLRSSPRTASASLTGSMRFSGPCARR